MLYDGSCFNACTRKIKKCCMMEVALIIIIIIIIIMVYRITGLSSLYDSLVCVAVWSNFIGSCLQYSSSLFLNALILIAFTTYLGRLFQVFDILK